MKNIGIIELSTTHSSLNVAAVDDNFAYKFIDKMEIPLRLNKDMENDGIIKPQRVNDCIKTLQVFKKICAMNKVADIIAFTTKTVRDAKNQKSFLEEIYNTTGIRFRVLTEQEEIALVHSSVINTLDVPKGVIIDIQPAEINLIKYNRKTILASQTLDFGALDVAEMIEDETLSPQDKMAQMVAFVTEKLKDNEILAEVDEETNVVGTGSSFINLSKIVRLGKKYSYNSDHNLTITDEDFVNAYNIVKGLDAGKTKKIKGISEDRADLVASGIAVIKAFFDTLYQKQVVVCDTSLIIGMMYSAVISNMTDKPIQDILMYSLDCTNIFHNELFGSNKKIVDNAIKIYNELKVVHRFGKSQLRILKIAAYMCNVGYAVKFDGFERNNFSAIINADIYGASHKEIVLAAFVAASQNLEEFDFSNWVKYKDILGEEDDDVVRKLAVIVKIARLLDRTKTDVVEDIICDILGDSVILKVVTQGDSSVEVAEAMKAAPDFKKAMKKALQIL